MQLLRGIICEDFCLSSISLDPPETRSQLIKSMKDHFEIRMPPEVIFALTDLACCGWESSCLECYSRSSSYFLKCHNAWISMASGFDLIFDKDQNFDPLVVCALEQLRTRRVP